MFRWSLAKSSTQLASYSFNIQFHWLQLLLPTQELLDVWVHDLLPGAHCPMLVTIQLWIEDESEFFQFTTLTLFCWFRSIADRQRRTHFLMISLVVIFAIAWLPLNVFHLLNSFAQLKYNVPIFAFCHIFAVGSACLNPLAYAFFNQNFRSEFVSIFEKIGLM